MYLLKGYGKPPEGCPGRKKVFDRVVGEYLRSFGEQREITPVFTYDSCKKA